VSGGVHSAHVVPSGRQRTCVGCRQRDDVSELVRVVANAGRVIPDPARRLPGRGAHLHPRASCLARAERSGAFPRALRVPGPLDLADLRELVEMGMAPAATAVGEDGRSAPHEPTGSSRMNTP